MNLMVFMPSPIDSIKDITFLGCPSAAFVRSSRQILLLRYLVNGLRNTWWNVWGIFTSLYWWPD